MRPLTGWQTVAFALDWTRPPRHQSGTPFFYLATDQWRYERDPARASGLAARAGAARRAPHRRRQRARRAAGVAAVVSRASIAATLELVEEAERPRGSSRPSTSCGSCERGGCGSRARIPTRRSNHPKVMTVWRANLLGLLGQGARVLPQAPARHDRERGARRGVPARAAPARRRLARAGARGQARPADDDRLPDDRNALFSDVVLPAATWYEKYDLSSTDLHPFVHTFNEAVPPPWECEVRLGGVPADRRARSRELAERHLGARSDLVAAPLHARHRRTRSRSRWARCATGGPASASRCPGRTMPKLIVVERDYPHVARAVGGARAAARDARQPGQGRHLEADARGRGAARQERRGPRRGRGRAPVAGARASTRARRSSRCRARPTAGWRSRGSARWSARTGREAGRPGRRRGRATGSRSRTRRCSRGR